MTSRRSHASSLVWTLALLLLGFVACSKTPAPATEPEPARTRAATGPSEGGSTIGASVIAEPAVLDPARIERHGAWVADHVEGERYLVPVEANDLVLGIRDAPVTIVVFSDYQCPYCARLDESLAALASTYPSELRVVYKQLPLAMHPRARPAAEALLAAAVQGRGPAMHELLFANQKTLTDADLLALAGRAQVPDLARFEVDLAQHYGAEQIDRDIALAQKLGVTSTPSFFINGVPQRGAISFEQLRELFVAELDVVTQLMATGAARDEVYASLMHAAAPTREAPSRQPSAARPRPGKPDPAVHYAVPVDGRPSIGPDDAPVTIIEFSDFECPYCRKVQATLAEIQRRYPKDVRIVFRQQPLPMHKNAESAAVAALAADRQGKFWDMHDLLFQAAEAKQLGNYDDLAKQLNLDIKRFRKDMADAKLEASIAADQQVAKRFGASGTPTFFINGRHLAGAQPIEAFVALIDEELAAAKAYQKQHKVAATKLYETMSRDWESEVEVPPVAEHQRQTISVADLPGTGKLSKPAIVIVGCVDFDCPFCKRGADLMAQVLADKAYQKQVAYHFAHFPLPMHKNAEGAHRAAIAAGEQGKFWDMHDLLFADQKQRGEAEYVELAAQLGLDTKRFLTDWNSTKTRDKLDADKSLCTQLGVSGTPSYFVNGRLVRGAIPFEELAAVLDEELAGGFEAKAKSKSK